MTFKAVLKYIKARLSEQSSELDVTVNRRVLEQLVEHAESLRNKYRPYAKLGEDV